MVPKTDDNLYGTTWTFKQIKNEEKKERKKNQCTKYLTQLQRLSE